MASTPEGKVKQRISKYLSNLGEDCYYEMPVPGGYGKSGLDYSGCYKGRAFYIEAKAPGKEPTDRQKQTLARQKRAGATTFVIDGDISELTEWIKAIK